MNEVEDWSPTGATRPVPSWGSVIVGAPMHPEGSNENAAFDLQRIEQDGAAILAAIQEAGRSVQELQAKSRALTDRLRELVTQVREQLATAEKRVEEAEAREQEIRLWAEAGIAAAEDRVRAAEERAQAAEMWLARISDAVRTEFLCGREEALPSDDRTAA